VVRTVNIAANPTGIGGTSFAQWTADADLTLTQVHLLTGGAGLLSLDNLKWDDVFPSGAAVEGASEKFMATGNYSMENLKIPIPKGQVIYLSVGGSVCSLQLIFDLGLPM